VTARLTLLVAAGAAVLALCTGCQGMTGSTAVPPPTNQTAGFDQQLDQLQSTLDSVQAQINSDSTP
jgi:hypothetical protein